MFNNCLVSYIIKQLNEVIKLVLKILVVFFEILIAYLSLFLSPVSGIPFVAIETLKKRDTN